MSLAGIGSAIRRRSRFEPLRSSLLALGVLSVVLSASGVALAAATYAGWDQRGMARSPIDAPEGQGATALWAATFDTLPDGTQFQTVYLAPLLPDAEPPPGLSEWPAPSEVVLSPELSQRLGAHRGQDTRYGLAIATIQPEGLTDPHELLAYVGASGRIVQGQPVVRSITGFGTPWVEAIGDFNDRQSLSTMAALVVSLLLAPSLWLLANALRIGAGARARRVRLLTLLGADRIQVRSTLWGEARAPWAAGSAGALVALAIAASIDLDLPGLSFTLQARDVRDGWPVVAGTAAVALVGTVLAATSPLGLASERAHRVSARRGSMAWLRGAACPVVAALAVICRNLALSAGNVELAQLLAIVGPAVALSLAPMSAIVWVHGIATWARRRAGVTGDAAMLVGGAQLAARPRPAARFGATAAILIAVTAVGANVLTNVIVRDAVQVRAMQATLGGDLAVVQAFAQADVTAWDGALDALGRDFAIAELRDDMTRATLVVDSASDKSTFESSSLSGAAPAWRTFLGVQRLDLLEGAITSNSVTTLLVTSRAGGEVDLDALRDTLSGITAPAWYAQRPGGEWVSGAVAAVEDSKWLTTLGAVCLALVLLALWAGYANELRRAVRALFAVQLFAPDSRFVRAAVAMRVLAPVAVAVVAGAALAVALSIPRAVSGYVDIPYVFIMVCAATTIATGLVAWSVTWRACVRATRRSSAPPDE